MCRMLPISDVLGLLPEWITMAVVPSGSYLDVARGATIVP